MWLRKHLPEKIIKIIVTLSLEHLLCFCLKIQLVFIKVKKKKKKDFNVKLVQLIYD